MLASICALAIYLKTVFLADSMRWDPIVGHHIFNCSDSISFFSVWLRPTNASSRDVTRFQSLQPPVIGWFLSVPVLMLKVPAVKINVESHDAAGRHASDQSPKREDWEL